MLTQLQKDAIQAAILSTYVINYTRVDIPVVYDDQFHPERVAYPIIAIRFTDGKTAFGDIDGVNWENIKLIINVLAEGRDRRMSGELLNGDIVASEVSRLLMADLNTNLDTTLRSSNVLLAEMATIVNNLSDVSAVGNIFRYRIEIKLLYR